MKKVIMFGLLAFMSGMALACDNYSVVFKAEGTYEYVRDSVQMAIEGRGLKINNMNHTADMLERTGKDLGATKLIYEAGEQFEFCSAQISRDMMEADPHAIAMCPYIISVYKVPGDKAVYVSYRKLPDTKNPKLKSALKELDSLMTGIIKEAIQ
jgi:uncharacterized protein (DUF302 family)